MAYSESDIQESVNTVYLNSKRQAKRALVTNYANGDINFIGDCCFAYSGSILQVAASDVDLLNFNSGPNFIKAKFEISFGGARSNDDFAGRIRLNGVLVVEETYNNNYEMASPQKWHLVIPPFTNVNASVNKQVGSIAIPTFMNVTGQVYAGAELIQGAI